MSHRVGFVMEQALGHAAASGYIRDWFSKRDDIDMVQECSELHLLLLPCCLPYAVQTL